MTLAATLALLLGAQAVLTTQSVGDAGVPPTTAREQPHPALADFTQEDQASLAALGKRFAAIQEEAERARAIHDWLVLHLAYRSDGAPMGASAVFARRTANCDGYSQLFAHLGRAAGLTVQVVHGLARDTTGQPQAHAWNLVRIGDTWRFVDVTFDDPQLGGALAADDGFRTDYFFTAPEVAALDHLPNDPRWLLGAPRLTRAQFLAQGPARATSLRQGLTLSTPPLDGGTAQVEVKNAHARFLLLRIDGVPCGGVRSGQQVSFTCPVGEGGTHHFELFTNDADWGLFRSAAEWTAP